MMIRANRFNLYLILVVVWVIAAGCKSTDGQQKKLLSTLRLHQEINPDLLGRSETAEVYRESPIQFTVDKEPFLSEANVKEAKVIDVTGGFALEIQFDRQGSWLLEQYTAGSRSKHIAVESQFVSPGEEKINKGRWLAAPQIHTHITDGRFAFTPDTTREEAERIAQGLNNVAKKLATGEEIKW
jgi:preprotein translocase subunit SecD